MLIVDLRVFVRSLKSPYIYEVDRSGSDISAKPLDNVTKVTQGADADVLDGVMTQFVFSSATLLSDNSNFP